jgi:hypothetical protein
MPGFIQLEIFSYGLRLDSFEFYTIALIMEIDCLIKFGTKEFMTMLLEKGTVYMNTASYFRTADTEGRKDQYEGASWIKQNMRVELLWENTKVSHSEDSELIFRHIEDDGNLYCMTAIKRSDLEIGEIINLNLSPQLRKFGDTAIFIHNPKIFMARLRDKFESMKKTFEFGLVNYIDSNMYDGPYNIYRKPKEFSYQREFRIFTKSVGNDPLKFELGDISDVAVMVPSQSIGECYIEINEINKSEQQLSFRCPAQQ